MANMSETTPPDIPPVHASDTDDLQTPPPGVPGERSRRRSLRVMAGGLLAVLMGVPAAIASLFVMDPVLRRGRSSDGGAVRVADLAAVPDDGTPRAFPVKAEQIDGWTGTPDVEVGVVYLRKAEGGVVAWNARCPHLGCLIEYKAEDRHFLCPCHSSVFAEDGSHENDVSPRAMDTLTAEVRDGAVFVAYQDFKYRIEEKVPVS